jgi:hypothetical protein
MERYFTKLKSIRFKTLLIALSACMLVLGHSVQAQNMSDTNYIAKLQFIRDVIQATPIQPADSSESTDTVELEVITSDQHFCRWIRDP